MNAIKELRQALGGLWSLVVGLGITGNQFLRKTQTTHYPRQVVTNLDTFRGHIDLVAKDDDPSQPRCITCMLCASICPSGCLYLEKAKAASEAAPDGTEGQPAMPTSLAEPAVVQPKKAAPPKKASPKFPGVFTYNYNTCSLCGLCVQNCPVDSLMFSRDVYTVDYTSKTFEYDLLARMRARPVHIVPATGSGVGVVSRGRDARGEAHGGGVDSEYGSTPAVPKERAAARQAKADIPAPEPDPAPAESEIPVKSPEQ
jgi:NADH-quinone oxidoreductase subunit I